MKLFAVGLLICLAILALIGCQVDANKAREILASEGCTDITLSGHPMFACGDDDLYATAFGCVRNGHEVLGVICGGPLKGYTVRYR